MNYCKPLHTPMIIPPEAPVLVYPNQLFAYFLGLMYVHLYICENSIFFHSLSSFNIDFSLNVLLYVAPMCNTEFPAIQMK